MSEKTQHKALPFIWEKWEVRDNTLSCSYYKIEFTTGFGNFKKGDKFDRGFLAVDHMRAEAWLQCRNYGDFDSIITQKFKLVPTD